MSRKMYGVLILFVLSVVLGVLFGQVFFGLLEKSVPPVAQTDFNRSGAHFACILYGLGIGIVIFVWSLLVMVVAPVFRGTRKVGKGGGDPAGT